MATAAVLPLSFALWGEVAEGSVGSGLGTAVMKCGHFKDAMIVQPGLSNSPTDQIVHAHGRVFGCNKAGGGGRFSATMTMPNATCANRQFSGTATFEWANGRSSLATIMFHPAPVAPTKVEVEGVVTSGYFQGLLLHSFVRISDTFKGSGAGCSSSNLLKRIEFTNSQSLQLFTPMAPPTTIPQTPVTRGGTPVTTARTIIIHRGTTPSTTPVSRPTGSLAFTGSNSSGGALLGVGSMLAGGAALAISGRRRRHNTKLAGRKANRVRPSLWVSLPRD